MRMRYVRLLAGLLLCMLFGGCAGKQTRYEVREYLEEATGTSVSYVRVPVVFVHEEPGLAASGRDYVYLAPMAVSRGGERSFWLWLGVWSTVDRKARNEGASPLSIGPIRILADEEPMDLNLQLADVDSLGIRRMPYATPVTTNREYLAPVTRSQLQRLGHARILTLTDSPAGGVARIWSSDDRAAAVMSHFAEEATIVGIKPDLSEDRLAAQR